MKHHVYLALNAKSGLRELKSSTVLEGMIFEGRKLTSRWETTLLKETFVVYDSQREHPLNKEDIFNIPLSHCIFTYPIAFVCAAETPSKFVKALTDVILSSCDASASDEEDDAYPCAATITTVDNNNDNDDDDDNDGDEDDTSNRNNKQEEADMEEDMEDDEHDDEEDEDDEDVNADCLDGQADDGDA